MSPSQPNPSPFSSPSAALTPAKLRKIEIALNAIQEAIVWTDEFGHVDWCNQAFTALVCQEFEQILATPLIDSLPLRSLEPDAATADLHPIRRALTHAPQGSDLFVYDTQPDPTAPPKILDISWACVSHGTPASTLEIGTDAIASAPIQTIVLAIRDVTRRHQAELELRQKEARYALAAAGANDGLWDWDLTTDVIYFSDRWLEMLGLDATPEVNTLQDWFDRIHPQDVATVQTSLNQHLQGQTAHFEVEYRIRHANGSYRWMLSRGLAIRNPEQQVLRMAGSQTDLTKRKATEEQLRYEALHDRLTNLPNRALFQQHVADARRQARQTAQPDGFAILLMDLDRFTVINDSLGPSVGDQLLIEMARRLDGSLSPQDVLARMGGDEFAVLLRGINHKAEAIAAAQRLQIAISQPYQLKGREVLTTASIGIVLSNVPAQAAEDLIRNADIAAHRAKQKGNANIEMFDRAMHTDAMTQLQLEHDLRLALSRNEFCLYYQPIVSLNHNTLLGFEALIRWHHPEHGFISPGEFIPVAEDTGMIVPIGYWVLREACQQLRDWQTRHPLANRRNPLRMSVNLSGRQFNQPDLVEQIEAILDEIHLDARCLKLEITESVIMDNADTVAEMLGKLQLRGIQVSIDDFGTGYSSLSYLYQLPIDTLKIDRSFINSIDKDGEKLELVRTIVSLAWNLGMDVIAEGVETKMQLAQLKALRCEAGQGYLFDKPLSAADADLLLQKAEHHDDEGLDESTFIGI